MDHCGNWAERMLRTRTLIRIPVRRLLYLSRWEKNVGFDHNGCNEVCEKQLNLGTYFNILLTLYVNGLENASVREKTRVTSRFALSNYNGRIVTYWYSKTVGGTGFDGKWRFAPKVEMSCKHSNVHIEWAFGSSKERTENINYHRNPTQG